MKKYLHPEIEILTINNEDVIMTSVDKFDHVIADTDWL